MGIRITVSTSEWVVVNKVNESGEQNVLVTSGLCSCIAIAAESEKQICLMHVYFEDLKVLPSERILRDIELPFVVMRARGGSPVRSYSLVYQGPTDKERAGGIVRHLNLKYPDLAAPLELHDNGCEVSSTGNGEYLKLRSQGLAPGYDYKNCTGAMEGLSESKRICIETWGKIGTQWKGNWSAGE